MPTAVVGLAKKETEATRIKEGDRAYRYKCVCGYEKYFQKQCTCPDCKKFFADHASVKWPMSHCPGCGRKFKAEKALPGMDITGRENGPEVKPDIPVEDDVPEGYLDDDAIFGEEDEDG